MVELLGGRAAEQVVFGELTTGAGNDLERVSEIAKKMVCSWGMSEQIGPMTIGRDQGEVFLGRELVSRDIYSNETAKIVDEEIRSFINNAHQEAVKIMNDHRELLELMSKELFEKETLGTDDIFGLILDNIDEEFKPLVQAKYDKAKELRFEHCEPAATVGEPPICNETDAGDHLEPASVELDNETRKKTMNKWQGTTILGIHRNGHTALCGDGQVTMGDAVVKSKAIKIRRIFDGKVIIGFAGATADAFTLFEMFEDKLLENKGVLRKAAVELAKEWRSDKYLRRLEAMLIAGDTTGLLVMSGMGDVLEPDDGLAAIGSGGDYALSAAKALVRHSKLSNLEVVTEAVRIASEICIYTNDNLVSEEI